MKKLIGVVVFLSIGIISVAIGAVMATYFLFGVITLVGFIALVESIGILKHLVAKATKIVDVILFLCTLYACIMFGVTIAASLTIAGLGYTLIYAPYLRTTYFGSLELVRYRRIPYWFKIRKA